MSNLSIPPAFRPLYLPKRHKIFKGGRASAKSHQCAKAAVMKTFSQKERFLCLREVQNTIADSVHRLLCDKIAELNLGLWFTVTNNSIINTYNDSEFLFKGMRQNYMEVKSTEGITTCWYEEAQKASKQSLDILIPTIRAPNSELWWTYNPMDEKDPIDQMFVTNPRDESDTLVRHVTYRDNPYFSDVMELERQHLLNTDPVAYDHVWEGGYLRVSDASIFAKRCRFDTFQRQPGDQIYQGADFGYAADPATLVACFIRGKTLFVEYAVFGNGIELDEMKAFYEQVPDARKWPIFGDSSRPETISYLKRKAFNIKACDKWTGSVEDGIAHIKGFDEIVIHTRNKEMMEEARLYSFKVDKVTGEILPIIVDAYNHGWDAIRYALNKYIQKRGSVEQWKAYAS